jgi:hypothetical protein
MKELALEPMDETVEATNGGSCDRMVGGPDSCGTENIFDSLRDQRVKNALNETDEMLNRAGVWADKLIQNTTDHMFKQNLIEIYAQNYQIIRNQSF